MRKILMLAMFFIMVRIASASEIRLKPIVAFKITTPQRTSFSIGVLIHKQDTGLIFQFEPGNEGDKLELGYGAVGGNETGLWGGSALKISLLKTKNNPIGVEKDQKYIGVEFEIGIFINLNVGIYRHIQGDDNNHNTIISSGIGIGF